MNTLILCAPGLEECEALVTHDLLFRAGIEVKLAGFDKYITSSREVTFMCDYLIEDVKEQLFDCLVLPGGIPGTYSLEANTTVQYMIDNHLKNGKYVAAICAAPSILIHKGLLHDNEFICSPGFENGLTPIPKKAHTQGKIITGKGLGAAVEFSYEIIKALVSEEKAKEVLNKICY